MKSFLILKLFDGLKKKARDDLRKVFKITTAQGLENKIINEIIEKRGGNDEQEL